MTDEQARNLLLEASKRPVNIATFMCLAPTSTPDCLVIGLAMEIYNSYTTGICRQHGKSMFAAWIN